MENLKWSQEELNEIDQFLAQSQNEKIIRFREYNFPFEGETITLDGLKFKTYRYPPSKKCLGIIFYVHGFTDYVGRFAHLAQYLSELGYDFHGMDQRGHGQSEGETALIPSIEQICQDTIKFHQHVLDEYYKDEPRPPIYVIAFSMGCMQMLEILSKNLFQYDGAFLTCPFWGFSGRFSGLLPYILNCYSYFNTMTPYFPVNKQRFSEHLHHWAIDGNNQIQKKSFPIQSVLSMCSACNKIKRMQPQINTPVCVAVGSNDKIVCNVTAKRIYDQISNPKNQYLEYETEHDPYSNAIIYKKVLDDAYQWFQTI